MVIILVLKVRMVPQILDLFANSQMLGYRAKTSFYQALGTVEGTEDKSVRLNRQKHCCASYVWLSCSIFRTNEFLFLFYMP